MANIDMFDYILQIKQPPPVTPAPKPEPAPKKDEKLTRAQIREKKLKERAEIRAWWAGLPDEEQDDIRSLKYPVKPKDKKKPKPEEKVKIIKVEVQVEKPAPAKAEEKAPGKPDWESYRGPQQLAMAEM